MPHDRSLRKLLLQSGVEADLAMLEVLQGELHPFETSERRWLSDVLSQKESPDSQRMRAAMLLAGEQSRLNDVEQTLLKNQADAIVAEMLRHSTNALLTQLLRDSPEPLLADWLEETMKQSSAAPADPRKHWYVTPEGHTMAIIDARAEPSIGYVYEISTGEVTIEQFLRYDPNHVYRPERSPEPKCPTNTTHWPTCVGYCRWLGKRLGADPEHAYPDELSESMPDIPYHEVIKHGSYRLPTHREWTYACAAGTTSYRYFGFSDELVDKYYQYYETGSPTPGLTLYAPAGKLKPNDFGLFNLYDGVREWGHDSPPGSNRRYIFGASSNSDIGIARTLEDSADLQNSVNGYYGLRIARTVVDQ